MTWKATLWTPLLAVAEQLFMSSLTAPLESPGDANETTDSSPRQPLWFDYPDTDKKKIAAIYKLIGEEHEFVGPNLFPYYLRYILIGSVVLILLFFVYQIIVKMLAKRDA